MFSDFDADPLLIHPSLNHGMGIVAAAQILKEKSVALDPSQTCEKYSFIGWILLNVETMPNILRYLITSKLLLSNVRFSASFQRLEESTH